MAFRTVGSLADPFHPSTAEATLTTSTASHSLDPGLTPFSGRRTTLLPLGVIHPRAIRVEQEVTAFNARDLRARPASVSAGRISLPPIFSPTSAFSPISATTTPGIPSPSPMVSSPPALPCSRVADSNESTDDISKITELASKVSAAVGTGISSALLIPDPVPLKDSTLTARRLAMFQQDTP